MRKLPIHLLAATLLLAAANGQAQQLEHLHVMCASGTTKGISVSPGGVIRPFTPYPPIHESEPFLWDSTRRLWIALTDPFIGDSLNLETTLISPSGVIFDLLSNGWTTKSSDHGVTFSRLTVPPVYDIIISPLGELFEFSPKWLYRSTDLGQSWDSILSPSINAFSQCYFDKAGSIIDFAFPGSRYSPIYRLARGDTTFDSIGVCPIYGSPKFMSCSVDSSSVFLATHNSLYRFTEATRTFDTIPLSFVVRDSTTIDAICCDSSGDLYMSSAGNIFRSQDTSKSWTSIYRGGSSWLAFQPPASIWAGGGTHLYQYRLDSLVVLTCDSPFEAMDARIVAIKGDSLYAGIDDDSMLFLSTTNGDSWKQIWCDSPMALYNGSTLQFAPDGATYLSNQAGIAYRTYGGVSWDFIFPFRNSMMQLNTVDSQSNLYSTGEGGFWISKDAGMSWSEQPFPPSGFPLMSITPQGFLCAAFNKEFVYSTDHGQSWIESEINDTLAQGIASIHTAFGRIWLSFDSVLLLSTDDGASWSRAMQGLQHSPGGLITTDPVGHTFCIQGKMFLGTSDSCSIYVWNPNDRTWSQLTPATAIPVNAICANGKYLFIGGNGVYRVPIADFNLAVSEPTSLASEQSALAYPNPSSKNFSIRFYLEKPSSVSVSVYDVLGRNILHLNAGERAAGWNDIPISEALSPGTYSYRIEAGGQTFRGQLAIISP